MQRFYVDFSLGIDLILTNLDIIHQLTRVMRSKEGDEVILFDGDGSETLYRIEKIEKKSITLLGLGRTFPKTEPKKYISLYQAIPNKLEKLEFILQKGVEVGIQKFIFFRSDYSQKLILSDVKKIRLNAIVRESLEQCGGVILPQIEFQRDWPTPVVGLCNIVLDTIKSDIQSIQAISMKSINFGLFVGPEGGWSERERDFMKENGFIFAQMGNRIMRTETAGIAVSFLLQNQ